MGNSESHQNGGYFSNLKLYRMWVVKRRNLVMIVHVVLETDIDKIIMLFIVQSLEDSQIERFRSFHP